MRIVSPDPVGRHGRFEAEIRIEGGLSRPFSREEADVALAIASPSGRTFRVPAFWYRPFRPRGDDPDALEPAGEEAFRVRFSPSEEGRYRCRAVLDTLTRREESALFTFSCAPSDRRGPVRAAGNRFETADGARWFPIGHNVAWAGGGASLPAFAEYFARMGEAGENAARVWLASWGLRLEGERAGEFSLENAWRIDRAMEMAEERGIRVLLCVENFRDVNEGRGRPPGAGEFFTRPEEKARFRRKLDYLAARFGAHENLLGWELMNEADNLVLDRREEAAAWIAEMARYLKRQDVHGHPVTVSFERGFWEETAGDPAIDFLPIHVYLPPDGNEADLAEVVAREVPLARKHKKPAFLAEFGAAAVGDRPPPLLARDPKGFHLTEGLWAGALSGYAGAPMAWWWDHYIHPRGLYDRYEALARFLEEVPPSHLDLPPIAEENDEPPLLIRGLKGTRGAVLWVRPAENRWQRLVREGEKEAPLPDRRLSLKRMDEGSYRWRWFDIGKGEFLEAKTAFASGGGLSIPLPAGLPQAALLVEKREPDDKDAP